MQDVTDAAAELERGDRPAAIARLRAARDAHPDALDVHALLGPLLQQADEREEAFRSFTVLRGATGGDIPTPLFLRTAQELRRRGLPRAAAFLFEVALSRSPDSEEARYYLALSLLEAGDAPAAVEAGRPLESPPPSS
jgi:tetratricopeptide (TPR) repeat protein